MSKTSLKRAFTQTETGRYAYFVLSTGTFQTYRAWKSGGRANPFTPPDYRSDMVTRTEITNLFFQDV